jgi:polyhydroxyalkanoate synthesis regulator phasin
LQLAISKKHIKIYIKRKRGGNMEDFLKKVAFLGLGTAAVTREKVEAGVEKLIKKGEITAAQGKKLAQKLLADVDRTRKDIAKKIDDGVKAGISKAGFVNRKEHDALKRRIEVLERRLAVHEGKPGHTPRKPKTQN